MTFVNHNSRRNKEFEAALEFVRVSFPELFSPALSSIELVGASDLRDYFGQCVPSIDMTRAKIKIRNGRQSACEFVDTIVHELTHVAQLVSGAWDTLSYNAAEAEANTAAAKARKMAFTKWPDGWAFERRS